MCCSAKLENAQLVDARRFSRFFATKKRDLAGGENALPSSRLLSPSAPAQWPASCSSVATAPRRTPSSSSRAASRSIGAPLSPCSAAAWRAAALRRHRTWATLSDAALRHGQPPTVPMLTQSAPLAAGAAIVSDATSISLSLSVLPPPGQPSTPTPPPIYATTFQPGVISNPPASLGSPAPTPQPQLVTVPPYGTPLAYSVATAGSSQATLPRV
ncbi:uncharacterized protein UHOD_11568 [Ustilago sp. UG-2017b]|nr:uncharacterized protein UHOD_11568 [Ustilago sp. UG-2017b]